VENKIGNAVIPTLAAFLVGSAMLARWTMATKYKPVTSEPESVLSTLAKIISDLVPEHRSSILESLNFYAEHGRPGEMGGKFDVQIKRAEDEVLEEIAGILTFAFARAVEAPIGVVIATLERIKKHPSAAQNYALPGFAEWLLAAHYQRADEEKGTYYPDIMGFAPNGSPATMQIPTEDSIIKAASAALEGLGRRPGRPSSEATRIVSKGLREIFLRYNVKIARRSEISSRHGELVQVEAGPFFGFVSAAIVPLQNILRERRLPPLIVESIVRLGRYPIYPITVRFHSGPDNDNAPDTRHSAATKEHDHEQPGEQAEQ
jgi:hypothetical protein